MKTKPQNKLLLEIFDLIEEALLMEQPIPPFLLQQIAKEKTILQQLISNKVGKATVQGSPIVNQYIQYALSTGIGNDPAKMLAGFDQFYIKKNAEQHPANLVKKPLVAPPTSFGLAHSSPNQELDKSDPFGSKARAEERAAQNRLDVSGRESIAARKAADEFEDKRNKKTVMRESAITGLIKFLIRASQDSDNGDSTYLKGRSKFVNMSQHDLEYIDNLYSELKDLIYRLKRLSYEQQANPMIRKILGSSATSRLTNAIKGLEAASRGIETSLTNKTRGSR